MRYVALSFALPVLLLAQIASAEVLITELQPNPVGTDTAGEWIELQNIGTSSVSIAGWTLVDYTGANETGTKWAFPAGSSLEAGQVIVVALTSFGFSVNYSRPSDYELASGMDDPMVPNLTPDTGTSPFALVNNNNGDAVVLRDAMGAIEDEMEYGNTDRPIAGSPASGVANEGDSWIRVNNTGSSFADFIITTTPEPGEGFEAAEGPTLANASVTPQHIDYAAPVEFTVTATDADGVSEVSVYVAVATSSVGNAPMNYLQITMTSTNGQTYHYSANPGALDPIILFNDPATFHERYLRWYFAAADDVGNPSTVPADAEESATNANYTQRNVVPTEPSAISEVVATDSAQRSIWAGHSAKVTGTALAGQSVLSATRLDVPIQDDSGRAIRIFGGATDRVIRAGDKVTAIGEILQFRGSMELSVVDPADPIVTDSGNAVATTTITIADLLTRGEEFESRLVHIVDADFMGTRPDNWPARVQETATITDPSGAMLAVKVTESNELAMRPTPAYGFAITGVVTQFTDNATPYTGGYQLFPRGNDDIIAKPMPPPPDGGILPDSGTTGGGRDAGGGGGTVDAGTGGTGGTDEGGCNCNASTSSSKSSALAGLALLIAGLAIVRKRRS